MKNKFLATLLLFAQMCNAQQVLSLQQAIEIALENNLGIKIIKNELQIASNNNSAGNAGMLPQISASSGATIQSNNIEQRFSNGTSIEKDKVGANNLNAGIALNYTFFDGMKMFATKQKLGVLQAMGENNVRLAVQQTIESVTIAYINAAKHKLLIKAIINNIDTFIDFKKPNLNQENFISCSIPFKKNDVILQEPCKIISDVAKIELGSFNGKKINSWHDINIVIKLE